MWRLQVQERLQGTEMQLHLTQLPRLRLMLWISDTLDVNHLSITSRWIVELKKTLHTRTYTADEMDRIRDEIKTIKNSSRRPKPPTSHRNWVRLMVYFR